jgi:hypothetical protein
MNKLTKSAPFGSPLDLVCAHSALLSMFDLCVGLMMPLRVCFKTVIEERVTSSSLGVQRRNALCDVLFVVRAVHEDLSVALTTSGLQQAANWPGQPS